MNLPEHRVWERAPDATDPARMSLTQWGQYTHMNE